MRYFYPALLHKDDDTDFGVSFPDFPGCVGAGATAADAWTDAEAALALHVQGMLEDKEAIPEPTPLDAAGEDADPLGLVAVTLIPAALPARSARFNVTLPVDLVEAIDGVSSNRSAFLADAARARLAAEHPGPSGYSRTLGIVREAATGRIKNSPTRQGANKPAGKTVKKR
jgi:predicted RNase H-like HicB family nuclease